MEHRSPLAGNVLVAVNRGELDITGDNNSNGVQVTPEPNAGQFTVTGLDDNGATTINGQASVTVSGVTDATKINLGNGSDNLTNLPRGSDLFLRRG